MKVCVNMSCSPILPIAYQLNVEMSHAASSGTPTTAKEKHYAQLASRLALLSQNVIDLHGHVEQAAEHSLKTRTLAAHQASL